MPASPQNEYVLTSLVAYGEEEDEGSPKQELMSTRGPGPEENPPPKRQKIDEGE